jgi:hypothetical protein
MVYENVRHQEEWKRRSQQPSYTSKCLKHSFSYTDYTNLQERDNATDKTKSLPVSLIAECVEKLAADARLFAPLAGILVEGLLGIQELAVSLVGWVGPNAPPTKDVRRTRFLDAIARLGVGGVCRGRSGGGHGVFDGGTVATLLASTVIAT